MTLTDLDHAHAAMEAAPGDESKRRAFYGLLADTNLFLLLDKEPQDERVSPAVFEVGEGKFVLVFDSEERLVAFSDRVVPSLALPGRALVQMLMSGEDEAMGLGLNLDVAPSSMLLPADVVQWLAQMLITPPEQGLTEPQGNSTNTRPIGLFAPDDLPETVVTALTSRLIGAAELARAAWLVGAEFEGGNRGYLVVFEEANPDAEPALAAAVAQAVVFGGAGAEMRSSGKIGNSSETGSGAGVLALDAAFAGRGDPILNQLRGCARRLELPDPPQPAAEPNFAQPAAPGMDPDQPPILR